MMKIKITEIEATADDLRQSMTLSDTFANLLRMCLMPKVSERDEEEEDGDE